MAADWHKEAKTFSVADGKSGKKENVWWPAYSRLRTVDKEKGTATDRKYWLGGLWSRQDEYVLANHDEGRDVYRRLTKTSFNGFRTKTATYYPRQGKSSEERRYSLGHRILTEYDVDGRMLSYSDSDLFASFKRWMTPDGRKFTLELNEFGSWHRKRQEAVGLPNGRAVGWRTMERHIGSYSMKIEPDENGKGETKRRGFGTLLGKGWLFEGKTHYDFEGKGETRSRKFGRLGKYSLYESATKYDFENGTKTTSYSVLFGFRSRTKDDVTIKNSERKKASIHKHVVRSTEKKVADRAWGVHAPLYVAAEFQAGLGQLGAARTDTGRRIDRWRLQVAGSDRSDTVAFGESASEPGLSKHPTFDSRNSTLMSNRRREISDRASFVNSDIAAVTGRPQPTPEMRQNPPQRNGSRAGAADSLSIASSASGFPPSAIAVPGAAWPATGQPPPAEQKPPALKSRERDPRHPPRVIEADNVSEASGFSPSEIAAAGQAMRSFTLPGTERTATDQPPPTEEKPPELKPLERDPRHPPRVIEADNVSEASGFSPSEIAAAGQAMRSFTLPGTERSGEDKSRRRPYRPDARGDERDPGHSRNRASLVR